MLQESESARKRRILGRLVYQLLCISFTSIIYSLDAYVFFSTTLASLETSTGIVAKFGPLFTDLCPKNKTECIKVLFYQVPIDDYFGPNVSGSALIMVSSWVPIIVGLLATRLTFWKIHSLLQVLVSFGYSGVIYLLISGNFTVGMSISVILVRLSMSIVFSALVLIYIVVKLIRTKYYHGEDMPIIVGLSYNTGDSDADIISQDFWEPKKEAMHPVYLGPETDSDSD